MNDDSREGPVSQHVLDNVEALGDLLKLRGKLAQIHESMRNATLTVGQDAIDAVQDRITEMDNRIAAFARIAKW